MIRLKKGILIVFLVFLNSCIKENPTFEFTNKSNFKIDSISIFASEKCNPTIIKNILPNQNVNGEIIFCKKILRDGGYGIKIYSEGKLKKESGFSYFTNGTSLSNSFVIKYYNQDNLMITEN